MDKCTYKFPAIAHAEFQLEKDRSPTKLQCIRLPVNQKVAATIVETVSQSHSNLRSQFSSRCQPPRLTEAIPFSLDRQLREVLFL